MSAEATNVAATAASIARWVLTTARWKGSPSAARMALKLGQHTQRRTVPTHENRSEVTLLDSEG